MTDSTSNCNDRISNYRTECLSNANSVNLQ